MFAQEYSIAIESHGRTMTMALGTYLLVAIVKKELCLPLPLYAILQILSLVQFEKTPLIEALSCESYKIQQPSRPNQLVLFE